MLRHWRQALLEQGLKSSTNGGDEASLHRKEPPEERVAKHKVTEESEGSNFAQNRNEHHGRIGHSLHVAHVRPEDVEDLEEFHDL